ncbi:MAG: hypothetical protein QOJ63_2480 [Solirubrobacteraceae bacterium]|nr:hypothetical protein [Solirubrobacteraceae bacterium]
MARTLLNSLPTWLLAVLVVGGAVVLAVAGLVLMRRRFPDLDDHGINDVTGVVIGVLAAVFGIILGFVTVSLYETFTDTKATVQEEATELIQLYEDSLVFAPAAAAAMQREIKSYIAAVRFREWERMSEGRSDASVGSRHVADLYGVLRGYEPDTQARIAFYTDAVARVNDIVDARRARLSYASEELPGPFWVMLLVGTLMLIASLYLLGSSNRRLHTIMVVGVAVLTSFNLLIVVALDHPFSGDISVSDDPFDQEQLQLLHVTPADVNGR